MRRERKGSFLRQKRRLSSQVSMERALEASAVVAPSPPPLASADGEAPGGRRKLPKTPANVTQAELLLDLSLDAERQELAVTLLSARGVTGATSAYAYVLVQVLPGGQ